MNVQLLIEAGAIILVKANVAQSLFSIHSDNRVWGCALNPFDKSRSCGGSSGGDGGIIAARCAPFALGTDIGGSVRIPCHFNGICGLKPTSERLSRIGSNNVCQDNFAPKLTIKGVAGPMGRTVDDLVLGFKVLLPDDINLRDCTVSPCPFNE